MGIFDHWGEGSSILNCSVLGKEVAIFNLSYNYMKMISLQNIVEEIINRILSHYFC